MSAAFSQLQPRGLSSTRITLTSGIYVAQLDVDLNEHWNVVLLKEMDNSYSKFILLFLLFRNPGFPVALSSASGLSYTVAKSQCGKRKKYPDHLCFKVSTELRISYS